MFWRLFWPFTYKFQHIFRYKQVEGTALSRKSVFEHENCFSRFRISLGAAEFREDRLAKLVRFETL